MKRIIAILLVLAVCAGLCACGGRADTVLPTIPEQLAVPTQSVTKETPNNQTAESTEPIDPTGETYPWEAEFREEDYFVYTHIEPKIGTFTSYMVKSIANLGTCVRTISEYTNGDIEDTYFYPSGLDSHSYRWYADGSFEEYRYLDDGRIDLVERKTYMGTVIYQKNVAPDGAWSEFLLDESGNLTRSAGMDADGTYREFQKLEDGTGREVSDNPNTGERWETEYFENSSTKRSVGSNSRTGTYYEIEYYENGKMKYAKNESPENTTEERYNEEGCLTYFYSKNTNYELELISDETGKLIKVTENGTVIEDATTLAQYAKDYNFKE